jgi:hypothetical protein
MKPCVVGLAAALFLAQTQTPVAAAIPKAAASPVKPDPKPAKPAETQPVSTDKPAPPAERPKPKHDILDIE